MDLIHSSNSSRVSAPMRAFPLLPLTTLGANLITLVLEDLWSAPIGADALKGAVGSAIKGRVGSGGSSPAKSTIKGAAAAPDRTDAARSPWKRTGGGALGSSSRSLKGGSKGAKLCAPFGPVKPPASVNTEAGGGAKFADPTIFPLYRLEVARWMSPAAAPAHSSW